MDRGIHIYLGRIDGKLESRDNKNKADKRIDGHRLTNNMRVNGRTE